MQPAEPITLGYYLAAHLHALERDFSRLENCYERLNQSPLGSGAMAATTFDIDRELTAELLGFNGPTGNSLDGIASRDYVLEILSALSIFMIHLSRLSHDLYIWSTEEFSLIEVNGSVAMCSSIMPQKKNPVTFEHIKSKAAHLQAAYISASSCLKNTPYTQCRDSSMECLRYFWDSFFEVEASIYLLITTLKTIKINEKHALDRTFVDFSTVTELSNTLVKEVGLSNSLAHNIVANIVIHIIEQGQNPTNINSKLLTEISSKLTKKNISLSDEKIQLALDPVLNINSRKVTGSPCPSEVEIQLKRMEQKIKGDDKKISNYQNRLLQSKTNLHNRIKSLLKHYR
jgi:argininosuccinate lyase